jgi:hypothetical protein
MGQQALAKIKNYFRNTALWLSSPAKQRALFNRATWGYVLRYPALERLDSRMRIWELGQLAHDAIGRRAGQCVLTRWIFDVIQVPWEIVRVPPNPCLTCPPFELFEIYALGGIVQEMLKVNYELEKERGKVSEAKVAKAMAVGIDKGTNELVELYRNSLKEANRYLNVLEKEWQCKPDPEQFRDPSGQ